MPSYIGKIYVNDSHEQLGREHHGQHGQHGQHGRQHGQHPIADGPEPVNQDRVYQSTLPSGTRIIKPDSMVTMDYRPERLNLHIDRDGKIVDERCG